MPSSKGKPTDPELREKIKEEVQAEEKGLFGIVFVLLFVRDFCYLTSLV